MLSFFPDILEDETLYSVVVRTFKLSGFATFSTFTRFLFQGNNIETRGLYPKGLELLDPYLVGSEMEKKIIIENLTLLPYFRPFMSRHGYSEFLKSRDANNSSALGIFSTGLSASRVRFDFSTSLRFCSECAHRQLEKQGYTAWLRSHQLPGVNFCWFHGTALVSVTAPREHAVLPSDFNLEVPNEKPLPGERWIADASRAILWHKYGQLSASLRRHLYRTRASDLGSGTGSHLSKAHLKHLIQQVWFSDTLEKIGLAADQKGDYPWIASIIGTKDRSVSPLVHLILIRVLFKHVDLFFESYFEALNKRVLEGQKSLRHIKNLEESNKISSKNLGKQDAARKKLSAYLESKGEKTRSGFRTLSSQAYMWLYKNDREWMAEQFDGNGITRWKTSGAYRKVRKEQ